MKKIFLLFLISLTFAVDFRRQIFAGYQGWFSTPKNGIHRWMHWSGTVPSPGKVTFELYPDVSDYPDNVLEQTNLGNLGNGQPSKLYTSDTDEIINIHLNYMQRYGIDGIALQRFVCELYDNNLWEWRTSVLERIQRLASRYGRYFYVEYDITGSDPSTLSETIRKDWDKINMKFNLVNNPFYAKAEGKPVVALWGYGFGHNRANPEHLQEASKNLRRQGIYVVLGVPYSWREGGVKPGFNVEHFLENGDMIQPWAVGSFRNSQELNGQTDKIRKDKELCLSRGIDYQRVIWPGFAWSNWNGGERNMIPRHGGQFIRDQFSFTYSVDPIYTSMFIAMFDEFDEGTAILKAATDKSKIPVNQYFLTLDADGLNLPADHYLKIAGELTNFYHSNVAPNCDFRKVGALNAGEELNTNCMLHSPNLNWHLVVQNNGYFAIWGRQGSAWKSPNHETGKGPWKLAMQGDGNLVFYDSAGRAIWASNTAGKGTAPYHLEMQIDGNIVIYDANHKAIWAPK